MAVITPDLDVDVGEDFTLKVLVKNPDGTAKDLTGATVEWRLGSTVWQEYHFAKAGTLTTDGSDGYIQVAVTDVECATFTPLIWEYSFWVTESGGEISNVKTGWIEVSPSIPAS